MPLVDQGLVLNKQQFKDALRLRYNMRSSELPSVCACGEKFADCHALSCKKGGFVAQSHAGVRNLLTSLQPLDNERFNLRSEVTSSEARLDLKAGGFWSRKVTAFFDVRVTHVNSKCNQGKATSTIFKEQEEKEKRKYQLSVLDVEMGSFTPLILEPTVGWEPTATAFSTA